MRSGDIGVLNSLIQAASQWRTDANSVGVKLDIITTRIQDELVQLEWLSDLAEWEIRTMNTTFTAMFTAGADPDGGKWTVTAN